MIPLGKIFLVGMPGSGKSTIGKDLAHQLGLPFVDLDDELEKSSGSSIEEIFARDGEETFRILEKDQLEKSNNESSTFVIATGGGTPCFFDNIEVMKSSGLVVFFDVSPKILSQRLIDGKGVNQRPLLKGLDEDSIESELATKLELRLPFYNQAQLILTEGELSLVVVQSAIEDYYKLSK